MPLILERFPGAQLLIAGDGDIEIQQELSDLREQLGLNGHVHLLGRRDDIANLLYASNIFVFSSYYEGLPGAVIEAMAARTPVVAFDIPSLKEVVQNRRNGILIKGRNIGRFAQAVIWLAEHPETCRQMGSKSWDIVNKYFNILNNVRSLESVYEKALFGYQSSRKQ